MRLARTLVVLGCVVVLSGVAPAARTVSADVSDPADGPGVAQIPIVPRHRRHPLPVPVPGPLPVPVPVTVPVPVLPLAPPPPPVLLPPPPPPAAGVPAVPIIPEADSGNLLALGIAALALLEGVRRFRGRRQQMALAAAAARPTAG
ncbi:MAG TPA: hypothetical protein VK066_23005 [Chloroflexota bacterium]|nr:hypothetical protein [Chloroflexota bacterium]